MTERETDYVAWTKGQAAVLRSLPAAEGIDPIGLADEVEGIGRAAVAKAAAPVVGLLAAALLARLAGESDCTETRLADMVECQADAVIASAGGVDRHLDLDVIWKRAKERAAEALQHPSVALEQLPEACPVSVAATLRR